MNAPYAAIGMCGKCGLTRAGGYRALEHKHRHKLIDVPGNCLARYSDLRS